MEALKGSSRAGDELSPKIRELKTKVADEHSNWALESKQHNDLHDKVIAAGQKVKLAHRALENATQDIGNENPRRATL
jgi:hypothetical protein